MCTIKKIFPILIFIFLILKIQFAFAYSYSEGKNAYDNKNYAKSFRVWYLLSLENDPKGHFGMGLLYKNGFDQLNPSCEYAIKNLSLAENSGVIDAIYELGDLYQTGKLCKKNKNKALSYYEKAANNNHLESIIRLAESYENGTLGPKDQNKSCAYSDQAANLGDAIGQYRSAKCYKYKLAGTRDFEKAINLLETAINQKIEISNNAKLELVNSDKFSDKLLCEWNEKLHQKDYMEGTYETALCLKYSKADEKNFDKAIKYLTLAKDTYGEDELFKVNFKTEEINCDWYQILHQNNYNEGTYEIAICYRYGEGRAENLEEARKLFENLVQGEKITDLWGKLELADMYLNGLGGEIIMNRADNLFENIINNPNSTDELIQLAKNRKNKVQYGWPECHTELNKTKNLNAKNICLAVAETSEVCAMLKVSQLYASGQSGFEKDKAKSDEWKSKVDRECGIAKLPHTGSKSCSGECEPPI